MKSKKIFISFIILFIALSRVDTSAQQRNYRVTPMKIDVGSYIFELNPIYGENSLNTIWSWMYKNGSRNGDLAFHWPADTWRSGLLYQIFNPYCLDENGIIGYNGTRYSIDANNGNKVTNFGKTDWDLEIRKYRPPHILVNGIQLDPPYRWYEDRNLISDIKIEFEDVQSAYGIRTHVEIYAFSHPNLSDIFIWKATHKFTGERNVPRDRIEGFTNFLPDQTIKIWFPKSFNFDITPAGSRQVINYFGDEPQDDLESWFKQEAQLPGARDTLYIGYYWDYKQTSPRTYPNGSKDDTGDPDLNTGFLYSTQIPGFTLLYSEKSASEKIDDPSKLYSMPHGLIDPHFWGHTGNNTKLYWRGDDARGKWPFDFISEGATSPGKGPMRFITVGPYDLTKDSSAGRYDSITVVYAVGVGSIGQKMADSIGKAWFNGSISDQEKNQAIMQGRDSLFVALNRANWAWERITNGLPIHTPPPPPDVSVKEGPSLNTVSWSYPDASYFNDGVTGVDDWYAWRVFRKRGALYTNDPINDQYSGAVWERVFETTDRTETTFIDRSVIRGVNYYYAVTSIDNGSQNPDDIIPNQKLESSRFSTMSKLPVVSFIPGLSESSKVRVVPNPATIAAGGALSEGSPNKISFFNLPYKCSLKIFTETGDLVKSIEHEGTADEEWDQRTDSNQFVTSGIYILAVLDAKALDGTALEDQFVKFVIVR
jgi:hypothetical protein